MHFSTLVKLVLEESPSEGVPGVRLCLYDRDRLSRDDLLGSETTDVKGEVCIHFSSEQFSDLDEWVGGDFPELYVAVCDAAGEHVFTTRSAAESNTAPRHMTVRIPRDVAERHELITASA